MAMTSLRYSESIVVACSPDVLYDKGIPAALAAIKKAAESG
jgi:hypothetical protein